MHSLPEPARPIFTTSFWADAFERAISAAATAAAAVITISGTTDWLSAPWYATASAAGIAGLLDLLRSLAAAPRGNPGTAGITPAIEPSGQPTLVSRLVARHRADTTEG